MNDEFKEETPQHEKGQPGDTYNKGGDFRGATINIKSNVSESKNNVRLQNLRDFTVQIRRVEDDAIVGTGIAVSTDGRIVTCAHVVEAILGTHPRSAIGTEVGIYFPQLRGGEEKKRRARVECCFPQYDDDIVLLQLVDGPSPLAPEQIAVLGPAFGSEGNNFRSYGFSSLANYVARTAGGIILGEVEAPINKNLRFRPLQLNSNQIDVGMSGAAILDVERNLVVGFISDTWYPQQSVKDSGTVWAVNAAGLAFPPFNLPVLGMNNIDPTQVESEQASQNRKLFGFRSVKLVDELVERAATTDQPINQLAEDALGFGTYVRALRDFIASEETSTPLTISVDSPWGYGKTSLMRMLQSELDPPKNNRQSLKVFWVWLKWSFIYIFTWPVWITGTFMLYLTKKSKSLLRIKWFDNLRAGFQIGKKISNVNAIEGLPKSTIFWAKISSAHIRMYPTNHITIWFNAWKFSQEEQLWAALALAVIEQIKEKYNPIGRLFFWLKLTFKRLSLIEAFWAILMKVALPLLLGYLAWIYQTYIIQLSGNASGLVNLGGPLLLMGALISGIIQIVSLVKDPFQIPTEKIFDRPNYKEKLGFLSKFEADFLSIVAVTTKSWAWKSKKLIIFIDDLDRCQPPKAVDIIEAINLFLDSRGCVFVLGMDSRAIVVSIETKYKDLLEKVQNELLGDISLGHSFLEKIIQVPFRVPHPTSKNIDSLVNKISQDLEIVSEIPEIQTSETTPAISSLSGNITVDKAITSSTNMSTKSTAVESRIDIASYARTDIQNAIAIGARLLENNPRLIKRFANIFRLFVYIANERGMFSEGSPDNNDKGLNPEILAVWLAWSMRWPRILDYLMIDEQRESLRHHLGQISDLLNDENTWVDPLHGHLNMITSVTKLRKEQKSTKTHWCHLPWDWWLLNHEFLKCIKGLDGFWQSSELKLDWLTAMLTMTAVSFDFLQTPIGFEAPPINHETKSSLPLRPAPEPKTDEQTKQLVVQVAQVTAEQRTGEKKYSWANAPTVLSEWSGRDGLLRQITAEWNSQAKRVIGLVGFGGEGKTSLVRKWVDNLLNDSLLPQPEGVFWWGFYDKRSVDEFLEAILNYMSGGRIDPRQIQSSNLRVQIIGAMLGTRRYLFVLDGLEVMQHQEDDQYGLVQSSDLRDLLTFFARPDNHSFCLITSRAPLLDLMEYTTYTHRDVDRLSEDDGRALLRRLGVTGSDAELNQVISDWDGHALTLSILAAYLAERYQGDIKHLAGIFVPTADEPRYERVHRVLRGYDEYLTEKEREFLKLFSVFRVPVQESAFENVFTLLLPSLRDEGVQNIVHRLVNYRLIRHDEYENSYTTHPLIRNHYFALLTKDNPSQEKAAHEQIKDYYLSFAGDTPLYPTLDDLKPLIEVVHHACLAGAYDEAWDIYWNRIQQSRSGVLVFQLGAYETDLKILFEFFPNGDITKEPQVSGDSKKRWILNEIGFCLMCMGRLREAAPFYERYVNGNIEAQDWSNASIGNQNLADLHTQLGALEASAEAARQSLNFASRGENKQAECFGLVRQGWAEHVGGNLSVASGLFLQAEKLEQETSSRVEYLYSIRGIFHADHLRRKGDLDYARRVTEANLQICEQNHWPDKISMCHRVLGDLDFGSGDYESTRAHYESALKIARGISVRYVLIEALLARGRFFAKRLKDANATFSDLNEALGYCSESGYRIYEADVRVALAWAYLVDLIPRPPSLAGKRESLAKAKAEAEHALKMSNEMGYYWGKVDAEEVLETIKSGG